MNKVDRIKSNYYYIISNKIRSIVKDSYIFNHLEPHFKKIEELSQNPLKLAVFGEFNAGKTSFINRLLGLSLPTKRVPTTKVITVIKYGETEKFEIEYKDINSKINTYSVREYEGLTRLNEVLENPSDLIEIKEVRIYIKNPILKTFEIIDTPGFNDIEFEKITKSLFDKVNFVIWIFSAHQVGSKSELKIIEEFKRKTNYKDNIYAFINQADIVDEENIKLIKEELIKYRKYFINDKIFYISSKKSDENWNSKFKELVEDIKSKVLSKDIEISEKQIEDEVCIIKKKLKDLIANFYTVNEKINNSINEFLTLYSNSAESKEKSGSKQEMIEQINNNIEEIKEEIILNDIFKNAFLDSGIKFLAYYKTIEKLDDIRESLKKVYVKYVTKFQKDLERLMINIDNSINNLTAKNKGFNHNIKKRMEKILFTIDTLKEMKQLLIMGYTIGILTDNFIYKNLKEEVLSYIKSKSEGKYEYIYEHLKKKNIAKNMNINVISNLIDIDLNIDYFSQEIDSIKNEIDLFFKNQIATLEKAIEELK